MRETSCLNKTHFGHYGLLLSSIKCSEMLVNTARYQSWGYIHLSVRVGSEGERPWVLLLRTKTKTATQTGMVYGAYNPSNK